MAADIIRTEVDELREQLADAREELKCAHFQVDPDDSDSFILCGHLEGSGLLQLLQEQGSDVLKAQEYMDNGADDARWAPGETAVEALIRENKELQEDRKELVSVRLAISKGLGVEKGHVVGLIEALYGRNEELNGILKERLEELATANAELAAFRKWKAKLCPHGYDYPVECPDCYLLIPVK